MSLEENVNFDKGILIFGFPRSGTTLARKIFTYNGNYLVYEIELHWLIDFFLRFGERGSNLNEVWKFVLNHHKYPANNRWEKLNINENDFFNYYREYNVISLKHLFIGTMNLVFKEDKNGLNKILVVKYPKLIEYEQVVRNLFKNVLIINMVRDPRSAIASHLNRWPSKELMYVISLYKNNIHQIKEFHKYDKLTLKFEDLILDSFSVEQKLQNFLSDRNFRIDSKLEHKILQFTSKARGKKEVVQLKGFQTNKIDNWKNELNERQITIIQRECENEMASYKYDCTRIHNRHDLSLYFYRLEHFLKNQKRKLGNIYRNRSF